MDESFYCGLGDIRELIVQRRILMNQAKWIAEALRSIQNQRQALQVERINLSNMLAQRDSPTERSVKIDKSTRVADPLPVETYPVLVEHYDFETLDANYIESDDDECSIDLNLEIKDHSDFESNTAEEEDSDWNNDDGDDDDDQKVEDNKKNVKMI